ncbi:GNAT family N-acetyltransferase [Kaistella sp.]|uniref:GNAT family N-acetyltransferase n=1 Tax=Kaistella sp. TaxID=2782235 RepID=UPI003C58DE68
MKFSTERLILRTITENDTKDILNVRSNPEINRFLHRIPPKDSLEALEFILNIKRKTVNNEILFRGIYFPISSKLIGTICLWKFSEDRKTAELGYELLPEYHGKGIMSEAVNFILNYGFNKLNLEKIEAFTNKNNLNSIKLLQKSNFILNKNRKDEKYPENLIFELNKI